MSDDHLIDFNRAGRITASVVAAILRCDMHNRSRKWAWRVITGREPIKPDTYDTARGRDHEEDALIDLQCELGIYCESGRFVPHPELDWLGASPDAIWMDHGGVLIPIEVKCPREQHIYIPDGYYAQIQTQMQCMKAPYSYFGSWVHDKDIYVQKVDLDAEWWTKNFPVLLEFYELYIKTDTEPPKSQRRSKKDGNG